MPAPLRWVGSAGSVLLEAVFALFLLGVVGLSLALLFTLSLRQMREAVARGEALTLALELREQTSPPGPDTREISPGALKVGADGRLTFQSAWGLQWLLLDRREEP